MFYTIGNRTNYLINTNWNRLQLLHYQLQLTSQPLACAVAMVYGKSSATDQHMVKKESSEKAGWVRPWFQGRLELGHYSRLLEELRLEDGASFTSCLRMDPRMFHGLL